MIKDLLRVIAAIAMTILVASCSDTPPEGPDFSAIEEVDKSFFSTRFNQCDINNSKYDCNCVAGTELNQRNIAFNIYAKAYESKYKPALEHEIETLETTIIEKSKNASDERIIESLEGDLSRLKRDLESGLGDKDNFTPPPLIPGSTDHCIITN